MSNALGRSKAGSGVLTKLNVASLLLQAGNALRKGNTKRAALLVGVATVTPRFRVVSYLVQGALGLDHLRRRLT